MSRLLRSRGKEERSCVGFEGPDQPYSTFQLSFSEFTSPIKLLKTERTIISVDRIPHDKNESEAFDEECRLEINSQVEEKK